VNFARLSVSYLQARPLATALSLLLLALGVGTIAMLLLVTEQLEQRMQRDARGIDLVVGAKGSPMQLILSGIYHLDAPTGNIPLASARELAKNWLVKRAMPLALGDGWKGFRIVGSGPEYLQQYGAQVATGRIWQKPMEVVLGAEAAARTGASVGEKFAGAHGVGGEGTTHAEAPYAIVGVLAPSGTVLDRLVLTSIESVWQVHEEHHQPADEAERKALEEDREVTVVLLQYASPLAAATLPRAINSQSELQAASPAYETARLFRIVGFGVQALRGFAAVLVLAAGFSVFIALFHALEERRFDLAVMRTLGASPARLFGLLLAESVLLSLAGAVVGLLLGHLLASAFGAWLAAEHQTGITGLTWRWEELGLVAVAVLVGVLAALVPAWRAYRTDVSRILAQT